MQCSLALEMQAHRFATERTTIAYILTLLTGRVLQWVESLWHQNGPATQTLGAFYINFREVFGRPAGDASIGEQLYYLKQGQKSIQEYTRHFRTLAASSGWNEHSLLTTYRQGLEPSLRLHLSAYDDTMGLERFLQLSIRVANPMQIDSARLTSAERRRRLTQGLCLYCGQDGHVIRTCPTRPP